METILTHYLKSGRVFSKVKGNCSSLYEKNIEELHKEILTAEKAVIRRPCT